MNRSVPQFFAQALGLKCRIGSHRCYFCGALCDESNETIKLVKKTFTAKSTVHGGDYVCDGCIAVMNQKATIHLPCGEIRENQKSQLYSYVITETSVIAATKSHREWILLQCLSPPDPPFVISITDSGQKHLLYLAVINRSSRQIIVTLEGETIKYFPVDLKKRLHLCLKIAAIFGKPSLKDRPSISMLSKLCSVYNDELLPEIWMQVREKSLTRLAIWLTPAKKECENELRLASSR